MIIDPPIDELINIVPGGKYATVRLISRRAHNLQERRKNNEFEGDGRDEDKEIYNPISIAAKEVYNGEIVIKT